MQDEVKLHFLICWKGHFFFVYLRIGDAFDVIDLVKKLDEKVRFTEQVFMGNPKVSMIWMFAKSS